MKKKKRLINKTKPLIVEKEKSKLSRLWQFVVGISIVVAIIVGIQQLNNPFLSEHEKYEKENLAQGTLTAPLIDKVTVSEIPPKFLNNTIPTVPYIKGIKIPDFNKKSHLVIAVGTVIIPVSTSLFYQSFDVLNPIFNCVGTKLILAIKDERLYVSTEFKDLRNEEVLGIMEFNHWKLYKPNLFDFYNDDNSLEVRDKENQIAFSLQYRASGVWISGYFIGPKDVLILSDNPTKMPKIPFPCINKAEKNWKDKARHEISTISSSVKKQ